MGSENLQVERQKSRSVRAEPEQRLQQADSRTSEQQEHHQDTVWAQMSEIVHVVMALQQRIDYEQRNHHGKQ